MCKTQHCQPRPKIDYLSTNGLRLFENEAVNVKHSNFGNRWSNQPTVIARLMSFRRRSGDARGPVHKARALHKRDNNLPILNCTLPSVFYGCQPPTDLHHVLRRERQEIRWDLQRERVSGLALLFFDLSTIGGAATFLPRERMWVHRQQTQLAVLEQTLAWPALHAYNQIMAS